MSLFPNLARICECSNRCFFLYSGSGESDLLNSSHLNLDIPMSPYTRPSIPLSEFLRHAVLAFVVVLLTGYGTRAWTSPYDPTNGQALRDLGQRLFFDPGLSRDSKISCSSCHQPGHAFSDRRKVAIGTDHHSGTRNTPSLMSLSGAPFFWDGRAAMLETVVLQPFTNPIEMGLVDNNELLHRLKQSTHYRQAFKLAFPGDQTSPALSRTALALATFIRPIKQGTSAYDRYAAGDSNALSQDAQHGLALFTGSGGCSECHLVAGAVAPFTDQTFHSTLINPQLAAKLPAAAIQLVQDNPSDTSLNARIESDALVSELGRYVVTHDPKDIGAFRTPSLRNVALTAPYMHDGSAESLRAAVDREIYYRSLQSNRPNTLTETNRQELVAFLNALTTIPGETASTSSKQ